MLFYNLNHPDKSQVNGLAWAPHLRRYPSRAAKTRTNFENTKYFAQFLLAKLLYEY